MEDLLWRNTVPNSVDGTTPAWIATFFAFLAEPNIQVDIDLINST